MRACMCELSAWQKQSATPFRETERKLDDDKDDEGEEGGGVGGARGFTSFDKWMKSDSSEAIAYL